MIIYVCACCWELDVPMLANSSARSDYFYVVHKNWFHRTIIWKMALTISLKLSRKYNLLKVDVRPYYVNRNELTDFRWQCPSEYLQRSGEDLRLWHIQEASGSVPQHRDIHRHPPVHGSWSYWQRSTWLWCSGPYQLIMIVLGYQIFIHTKGHCQFVCSLLGTGRFPNRFSVFENQEPLTCVILIIQV